MVPMKEKTLCDLWFHKTKSSISVQRDFRRCCGHNQEHLELIKQLYEKFNEIGSVVDLPRSCK